MFQVLPISSQTRNRCTDSRAVCKIRHAHRGIAGHLFFPAVVWLSLFLSGVAVAQQRPDTGPANASDARLELDAGDGYGDDKDTEIENPNSVDFDLNTAFPQTGAAFEGRIPEKYFDWKTDLNDKYGLKLAFSYQSLYQNASDGGGILLGPSNNDTAWGGWAVVEAKWKAFDRGGDFEGSLVAALDWRHTIGGEQDPANLFADIGSLWPTDFVYLSWDPWFANLYWEQKFKKDQAKNTGFVLRVGTQVAAQFIDFFRFKDARTSFSGGPFTVAPTSLPTPPPGLGASFRWSPASGSPLYVSGTINDMNAEAGEWSWDNAFDYGQFFYGLEVGYNWRRSPGDFDHLHLLAFYADEKDTQLPVLPNESGNGFKVLGSKQWGRIVGFGSYTYNTAEGGGFGVTFAKHTVNAGVALQRLLGINGELALGATWMESIDNLFLPTLPPGTQIKDQYGFELYWKLLLTPDLWITPQVQYIVNPSFNPTTDSILIPGLKFRLFF